MLSSKARESSSVAGKGRAGGLPDELQALIKSSGGTISQMKRLRSDGTWEDLMSDRDKKAAADREGKKKDDLLVMSCHRTRVAVYLPLSLLLPYSHIFPPCRSGRWPHRRITAPRCPSSPTRSVSPSWPFETCSDLEGAVALFLAI